MKQRPFTIADILNSPCGRINPQLEAKPVKKKNKFGNKETEVDGIRFQSTKEAKRYGELKILRKAGLIGQLELQVRFLLIEGNETERKCEYVADFRYIDAVTGETIVEDTKSDATRKLSTYILKRKLMKDRYNIEIKEI